LCVKSVRRTDATPDVTQEELAEFSGTSAHLRKAELPLGHTSVILLFRSKSVCSEPGCHRGGVQRR